MKFEEFLIQPNEGRRRRLALQQEVDELHEILNGELRLNHVLSTNLLLAELTMVEEEITWLERKLRKLRNNLQIISPRAIHDCATLEDPNRISEDLLSSLITMFLKMSKASEQLETAGEGSSATKNTLSCITCKARPSINREMMIQSVDSWDAVAYKGYTQITRTSLSKGVLDCDTIMPRISVLLKKICHVDLAFLNYKHKLAFWINVYNACIMNAYLQHGLPSTQEKMLSLMNKAALNVGGIVLNALAIEHYILRQPHDSKQDVEDEKEILLRRAYGLRYPEPNVTFALCRGNWSSPALKVYSVEEVVNELERAKVEYLEAWVGVRSKKKKILVPKLVRWHMRDFADDLESLIEWIYSQLPHKGLLKRRIMECLNSEVNPIRNMVEILPYEYDFRYLIASPLHTGHN